MALISKRIAAAALAALALGASPQGGSAAWAAPQENQTSVAMEAVEAPDPGITDPGFESKVGTWQDDFNQVATELASKYPKDFAESSIDAGSRAGWIGFNSSTPESAEALLSTLTDVTVRENLGYSAQDVDASAAALLESAGDIRGAFSEIVVFRDGTKSAFEVRFGAGKADATADAAMLGDMLLADTSLPTGFTVNVELQNEALVEEQAPDGGRPLGGCTTAFPVKRTGGSELGLLTAGHCPGTGSYEGIASAFFSPYPYSLATTTVYPGGDFRWNWSKVMLSGKTNIGSSTRAFATAAHASTGTSICNYGKTTAYKCSTVTQQNKYYSIWIPDGGAKYSVGPLRGTTSHLTLGGDSGGPWFFNSTAYGIHSGVIDGGSVFSTLPNALSRFGVGLWVG